MEERSDEDRLEAIKKVQEKTRPPAGFDVKKSIRELMRRCEPSFKAQIAFFLFLKNIVGQGHEDLSIWKKYKLLRSLSMPYQLWEHMKGCEKCGPVLEESLRQVEIFSNTTLVPPRILTREDIGKANRFLAEANNLTKEELAKWQKEVAKRVFKELNE